MAKPMNTCTICIQYKEMSEEHIPPKKAFNQFPVVLETMNYQQSIDTGVSVWQSGRKIQKGNCSYVLCEQCNNDTGSWYAGSYGHFVKQIAPYAHIGNTNAICSLILPEVYPLRVIKQVVAMFCGSCGPGLAQTNPAFTRVLQNKYRQESIDPFRIYLHVRNSVGGKLTGMTAKMDTLGTPGTSTLAEVSWWPVSWILCRGKPHQGNIGLDVTYWLTKYDFDDKETLALALPCMWAETKFPADFRAPKQIEKDRLNNSGLVLP